MQDCEFGYDDYETFNSTPMPTCNSFFFGGDGFSYSRIPQRPLRLTVLKLDGSSFEIEVPQNGTVAELKKAVEAAFVHLPCRVSWTHVWGHFCLSHDYEKLLSDSDPIGLYGIRDGDQLEFMRHLSIFYLGKRAEREELDFYEPPLSNGFQDEQANRVEHNNNYQGKVDYHRVDIYDDYIENEGNDYSYFNDNIRSDQKHKVLRLFRKWFAYRKLQSSEKRLQRKGSISRFFIGDPRNVRLMNTYRYGSRKIVDYNFETQSCIV